MVRVARPLSARRPLGRAWWLPLLAVGLMAGQAAGALDGPFATACSLAVTSAWPALWRWHRRIGTAAVLAGLAGVLGAVQAWSSEAARLEHAASFTAGPVELQGRVARVRTHRGRGGSPAVSLDLDLTEEAPPLPDGGRVRITLWGPSREWAVGETVRGRVAELRVPRGFCNGGADAYARTLWRQGILARGSVASDRSWRLVAPSRSDRALDVALHAARRAIGATLERSVPDASTRAVLAALVYGDQGDVPAELRQAYARTGTAHVLSVSGLHIAVVAMTCFVVLRRLLATWPWLALRVLVVRPAALAALLPATLYALLSGGAVATMRSLAMATLALGGVVLVRRAEIWSALAAAAILLCLTDPGVAGEPSFQLSFVAVAGLVAAGRRWEAWRQSHGGRWLDPARLPGRAAGAVGGALVAAVAAGLATGPFTAFHFGSVATLGVLANLLIVPLVGWLALLVALAGAAVLPLSGVAAEGLFALAARGVAPANAFVSWLASSPWCALDWTLSSPLEVACVLVPLAAIAVPAGRLRRLLFGCGAALAAVRACLALEAHLLPRLEVRFLDVGQGDAIVARLPRAAAAIVVDGGGLGGALDPGERVVVPALRRAGVRTLDAVALSHPDFDHYGGLAAVVRSFPVDAFWSSGRGSGSATFRALEDALAARGIVPRTLSAGQLVRAAGGATVQVLHPPAALRDASDNDASLVLLIGFGASRLLLTGDIQASGEAALLRSQSDLTATLVKVPHHGSRTSSARSLVWATQPGVAVALLGANNRFRFPASDVRERWRRGGALWLQSDQAGEVAVRSDGQLEVVASCRQPEGRSGSSAALGVAAGGSGARPLPAASAATSRAS